MQVCKAFYNAMQSHLLWTHISLQDSSVIDKTEAPVWYEPWKLPGKEKGFAAHLTAPKRPYFMSANFLSYLKRCHREHVIELDLSYVTLINQVKFLIQFSFHFSYLVPDHFYAHRKSQK